jgi:hypothetical protein
VLAWSNPPNRGFVGLWWLEGVCRKESTAWNRRSKPPGLAGELAVFDQTQSTFVRMHELPAVHPGDQLDVVGFVAPGNYSNILEDALVRHISSVNLPVPKLVGLPEILAGNYDASLIRVEGRLIGRMQHGTRQVLAVLSGADLFRADIDFPGDARSLDALRPGSTLRLTGVCIIVADGERVPRGFRLMLRTPADVVVVSRAPWWTLQRMLWVLAVLAIAITGTLGWVIGLSRILRNRPGSFAPRWNRPPIVFW